MLKSCTPVPTFVASFFLGREGLTVDWTKVSLIVSICMGAVFSALGETYWSIVGFVLMVGAIFSDVTRAYCMDFLAIDVKLDTLSILYYMSPLMSAFLAVGFLTFEADHFFAENGGIERFQSPNFVICLFLNASMAMVLNCAAVLFLSNVGLMTMSLVGIGKDIAMVGISCVFFKKSILTPIQAGGYSISLLGLFLYRKHCDNADRLSAWILVTKSEVARQLDLFLCCLKIGQGKRHQLSAVEMLDREEKPEYDMLSTRDEDVNADVEASE